MLKRINRACKYFPCHKRLEDCTFCYCPYYPCMDRTKGTLVYPAGGKKGVWSCEPCGWVHEKKVVDGIFKMICNYGRPSPRTKRGIRV